ncbi:MAG TPA: hypothetical protein VNJ70_00315 [Thermoanaerobaculia bacterium]|nr:hypothetical protein [Thermoanaerobaculia bacterium]
MSQPDEKLLEHWRRMDQLRESFEERWTMESFSRALQEGRIRKSTGRFWHKSSTLDIRRSINIVDALSLFVPPRLAEEEIGDAIERVRDLVRLGRPRWHVWLKVATTVFWVCLNSLREITSAVRGRASAKP